VGWAVANEITGNASKFYEVSKCLCIIFNVNVYLKKWSIYRSPKLSFGYLSVPRYVKTF